MNDKLIDLLYLVTSEANFIDMDIKNQIMFNILKYDMKVVITQLSDNKVELNFIVKSEDNFNKEESKGDKKVVDLELIKPFLIDYYEQYNEIKNADLIKEVGKEQYDKWLQRDLQLIANPVNVSGIENLYYDEMITNLQATSLQSKMMTFTNSDNNLNESISFQTKNNNSIGYLEFHSSHFLSTPKLEDPAKYTHLSCYINYRIPSIQLEQYPFVNQYYGIKTAQDIMSLLAQKNQNKELSQILQFINLNNKIDNKEKEIKNKLKI